MTLTGTYSRSLDDKRRLAVPKRLREEFGSEEPPCLYVAPGTDRSLALYAPAAFERLAEKLANQSTNRLDVRTYLRLFYARAEKVDLDGQGRIRIPDRLADFAQLERDIVLLGVHDHAEIWNSALWDAFLEQHSADFDEVAAQAFESHGT
jgi:MraZ protein